MLTKRPQVHIVSKEVTLATGEVVMAFFAVIDRNGAHEVRFLGTKPLQATAEAPQAEQVLALAAPRAIAFDRPFIPSIFEAISPYFTLDFLTSQLARAPSVK